MKKLVITALIVVIMLTSVQAQETDKVDVVLYFNAKSKQVQDVVATLEEGMRYKDKITVTYKDVSDNPDTAMWVNAMVKKLPENLRGLVDVIMVVGDDIELYGSRHIQQYMNQAILNKLGMKVEIPPIYTPIPVKVNPLDEINIKLNISLAFCGLLLLYFVFRKLRKRKHLKECEKIAKNEVINETCNT